MDPTRKWYHHPLVVFVVPLLVLIFSPHLYSFLVAQPWARPYNEAEIRQIATLLDEFYTMLADMTFIPHTAIKRGPHNINAASMPCKRDSAVIRLMELLPYIDPLEMPDTDWLFHANLMDYRRLDHLHEGCDPVYSETGQNYMTPHSITLMNWGDIDYRQGALVYDTYRRAVRVQQARTAGVADWGTLWPEADDAVIFGQPTRQFDFSSPWSFMRYLWGTWFDAPTLFKMVKEAIRVSKISPWEIIDRDYSLGQEPDRITKILHKNGWPDSFSPDSFNAELIRTKHRVRQIEEREVALGRRDELMQEIYTYDADYYPEEDNPVNIRLAVLKEELAITTDEQQQWVTRWQLQKETWDLERDRAELDNVQKDVNQLCPDDVCNSSKDIILWEYRAVERAYLKSLDMPSAESECHAQLDRLPEWAPPDADRFSNCVTQRNLKQHWLLAAYMQSQTAALDFCNGKTSCLLQSSTVENLAEARIAALKQDVAFDEDLLEKMAAWAQNMPSHATKATTNFKQYESAIVERLKYYKARMEWIEAQLAEGEKWRLWRCLDEYECNQRL